MSFAPERDSEVSFGPIAVKLVFKHLFRCSHNIAKKNLNDADSFDDCQPSLSKLENRQRCQKP